MSSPSSQNNQREKMGNNQSLPPPPVENFSTSQFSTSKSEEYIPNNWSYNPSIIKDPETNMDIDLTTQQNGRMYSADLTQSVIGHKRQKPEDFGQEQKQSKKLPVDYNVNQ